MEISRATGSHCDSVVRFSLFSWKKKNGNQISRRGDRTTNDRRFVILDVDRGAWPPIQP